MSIIISIQKQTAVLELPTDIQIKKYIKAAILTDINTKLTLRIIDEAESRLLNFKFRNKDKSTNVLAFPYQEDKYLGDLAVCAPVVVKEAKQQGKNTLAHWAHLLVHGTLHLQGYDHLIESDRKKMEKLEINILKQLKFPNPYDEEHDND